MGRTHGKIATHKNYVIERIRETPSMLQVFFPTWDGTVEELIKTLTEAPEEWFIGTEFVTEEQRKAYERGELDL